MRTNQLGTGLDLGEVIPIGYQSVTHAVFSPCGPNHLGADGAVVIQLLNVLINTEIFSAILCVVQCGAMRGRSGSVALLAILEDCIAISIAVQRIRFLWGMIRFSRFVQRIAVFITQCMVSDSHLLF